MIWLYKIWCIGLCVKKYHLTPFLAGGLSTNVDACIAWSWCSWAAYRILTRDLWKKLLVSTCHLEIIVACESRSKQPGDIALQVYWRSSSCWSGWSFISTSIGSTVSHNTNLPIKTKFIWILRLDSLNLYLFNSAFICASPNLDETIISTIGTPFKYKHSYCIIKHS